MLEKCVIRTGCQEGVPKSELLNILQAHAKVARPVRS
jgi:hypothetical protein